MKTVLPMLLLRLHRTLGLLFGPFLLIAALSGALYALTPQLENWLYAEVLNATPEGQAQPLSAQIQAAQAALKIPAPLAAVRPAPALGHSTRVMFKPLDAEASEHWAVFVDPVSLAIQGQLPVYGTSGVLPLRTQIGLFHRELLIGTWGRWYSELAASWLWLVALGGTAMWLMRRRVASTPARRWHSRLGVALLIGCVFFSATGLTWSRFAGEHISVLRAQLDMRTPTLRTGLTLNHAEPVDEHHEHTHHSAPHKIAHVPHPIEFERALQVARAAGIDANKLEIVSSQDRDKAWTVNEIDRSWPTQVDAVAIDVTRGHVTDRVTFAEFPLAAKLTRWGIDAHMGVLFGLANQVLLIVVALGIAALVIWGYVLAYRKPCTVKLGLYQLYRQLPLRARIAVLLLTLCLGYALPVLGVSLAAVLAVDAVSHKR